MYSFSTTKGVGERKVSKNIVLADLKKVFRYDKKNINSLFTKPEYDEWINDVAQANAMWYTFSDYDKHGENYMITDTKEELETLTREKEEYKKKVKEALIENKGKFIEKIPEEVLNKIVSTL